MSKYIAIACILLGAMISTAFGQERSFSEQLSVLDAQEQILRKQVSVRRLLEESAKIEAGSGVPLVISIYGFDSALVAKLAFPDGSVRTFRENQWINGYFKVVAIGGSGVVVQVNGKKRPIQLSFAPSAGASYNPQNSGIPEALLPAAPHVPMPMAEPITIIPSK